MLFFSALSLGANCSLGLELCKQLSEGGLYSSVYALCRKTSNGSTNLAADPSSKVKIIENIEVTKDEAGSTMKAVFQNDDGLLISIHLLVHNAGTYGPSEDLESLAMYVSQSLENVTAKCMQFAFELNISAPLMLTQALVPNLEVAARLADASGKLVIILLAMGCIEENGSGGHYGYCTAKTAVNMMSVNLKDKNIAVILITSMTGGIL